MELLDLVLTSLDLEHHQSMMSLGVDPQYIYTNPADSPFFFYEIGLLYSQTRLNCQPNKTQLSMRMTTKVDLPHLHPI